MSEQLHWCVHGRQVFYSGYLCLYRYALSSKFEGHLLETAPNFFLFFSYYFRETEEACAHAYMHRIIWQNFWWTQLFQVHNLYNVFWETRDVKHFWRPLGQLLGLLGYTQGHSGQFSWLAIAFCILHRVLFSARLTWSVFLKQKTCKFSKSIKILKAHC